MIDVRSFANIKNNPVKQRVNFAKKEKARYIRIVALSAVESDADFISIAELGVVVE